MKKLAFALAILPAIAPAQGPAYHDPGMKVVTQVAIVCRDIESTSKRWAAVLGVDPPRILTIKPGNEAKLVYRGHPSNGHAKLAFLNLGQVTLELIQPVGNDTAWKEFLDTHGEGVHHVANVSYLWIVRGLPVVLLNGYGNERCLHSDDCCC